MTISPRQGMGISAIVAAVTVVASILVTDVALGQEGIQEEIIDVPLQVVRDQSEGTVEVIATAEVPSELVGRDCAVETRGENNDSVHPDNHLVVTSGESEVRLENVEAEPFKVTTPAGGARLVLGIDLSIALEMGPHEIFSGGFSVVIDCAPVQTTTTTTTTPVVVLPSSIPPTVTEPPAPTTSTQVRGRVQVAPPAQVTPGQPSFTG